MKKFLTLTSLTALAFMALVQVPQAGTSEKLVQILVRKGILTQEEAQALMAEVQREEEEATTSAAADNPAKPAPQAAAPAQPPAPAPAKDLSKSFLSVGEKVKFSGDLRLRYDSQRRNEGPGKEDIDRRRTRYRLRFGMTAEPLANTKVGFQLASGSGYQNTTNQSFDEHGRGKNIFIDRAYASYSPVNWLTVTGGKHKNPFMTSSLVWDSDVTLEGFSEELRHKAEKAEFFATFTQFFVEELNLKAKSNRDPMMLGYQGGVKLKPVSGVGVDLGVAYYDFRNLDLIDSSSLKDDTTFQGFNNSYSQQMVYDANGSLLNEFRTVELNSKLKLSKVLPTQLGFFGSYIKNTAADIQRLQEYGVAVENSDPSKLLLYGSDDRDSGYQFGAELGYKEKKGDLYFQYAYQVLEDYAFPAVFVDSDFHGGGTNNRGHRTIVNYFLADNVILQGTMFFTKRDLEIKDGKKDESRLQLDLIFDF